MHGVGGEERGEGRSCVHHTCVLRASRRAVVSSAFAADSTGVLLFRDLSGLSGGGGLLERA